MIKTPSNKALLRFERDSSFLIPQAAVLSAVGNIPDTGSGVYALGQQSDPITLLVEVMFLAEISGITGVIRMEAPGFQDPHLEIFVNNTGRFEFRVYRDFQAQYQANIIFDTLTVEPFRSYKLVLQVNEATGKVKAFVNNSAKEQTIAGAFTAAYWRTINAGHSYSGASFKGIFYGAALFSGIRNVQGYNAHEPINDANLIWHWRCDEGTGDTLTDAAGGAYATNGTIATGDEWEDLIPDAGSVALMLTSGTVTHLAGNLGKGYEISAGRIAETYAGEGYEVGDAITASCWVKNFSDGTVVGVWKEQGGAESWRMRLDNGKFQVQLKNAAALKTYTTNAAIPASAHVAFTFAADTLVLYVNGVAVAVTKEEDDVITTLAAKGTPLLFAASIDSDGDYADTGAGTVDSFFMFNKVLAPADIKRLMLGLHPLS